MPSQQGGHLPQDSSWVKSMKNRATSTMQSLLSRTMRPPEPMSEPAATSDSKSMGVSRYLAGRQPPRGPPVWAALNSLSFRMPPPMS